MVQTQLRLTDLSQRMKASASYIRSLLARPEVASAIGLQCIRVKTGHGRGGVSHLYLSDRPIQEVIDIIQAHRRPKGFRKSASNPTARLEAVIVQLQSRIADLEDRAFGATKETAE